MHISRIRRLGIGLVTAALALPACRDDSAADADSTPITTASIAPSTGAPSTSAAADHDSAFPVTVTDDTSEVTIDARPERIVVLSAALTETVFAVGAGEQVVAVDSYSDHPADAPTTELSAFRPNIEAIGEYDPDLVLLSSDRDDIVATLDSVGIQALVLPSASSLDDAYAQVVTVGAATGHPTVATALADDMRAAIDEQLARVPKFDTAPTYYYELSNDYHSLTSDTFVGSILEEIGLVNIADDVDAEVGAYPQLSAEFILAADPDHVLIAHADGAAPTDDELAARPGWSTLSALDGGVTRIDPDIASRWGPRVVELVEMLVTNVVDGAA